MPVPSASTPSRIDLRSASLEEMEAFAVEHGQPTFRGRQLFQWIHGKGAASFDAMSNLPQAWRDRLAEIADLPGLHLLQLQTATDQTAKALFELSTGRAVETVLIPNIDDESGAATRLTVCVSSQVGCAMGCTFCATGQMGFQQNLTSGEILAQVRFMDDLARERFGRGITNIVFMGMGEPLLNFDAVLRSVDVLIHPDGFGLAPRRITISTVGLARQIRRLADEDRGTRLAISLHAPSDEKRSSIMPVNRSEKTDLTALKEAVQYYYRKLRRPIMYEYCLFHGLNDTPEDARRLAKVARWAPSKINLIKYNPVEGLGFHRTPEDHLHRFIRTLVDAGVTVTVRRSRGLDIDAACGQLAVKTN